MAGRYNAHLTRGLATISPISLTDLAWLVGFLEGEGSFGFRGRDIRVNAVQVQLWPLGKLQALLGGRIAETGNKLGRWNVWDTTGPRAVGIMMTCYALLSPRRQLQIQKALANWRSRPTHNAYKSVCPNGHPYDLFRVVKRSNGRVTNERGCSACRTAYYVESRGSKVANG